MSRRSVVVAMSGGVDSSVAALLLKEQGYQVIGMTLKTWPKELCDVVPKHQTCCSTRDIEDAQTVAAQLEIPFYVVEAAQAFKAKVMTPFVHSYARGETPNPCVTCNRDIKCGILMERARALGAQWLATGHYARVEWDADRGRYILRQGQDQAKDQSYVLSQITQEQLSQLLLPIGGLSKEKVRQRAREAGLKVAEKADSQELCFIPDGNTRNFLQERTPVSFKTGEIVNRKGERLGTHEGIGAYTIGQRKRLGIAHPTPLYVLSIDAANNRVVVGERGELAARSCCVAEPHWIGIADLTEPIQATVKIRYQSDKLPAQLIPEGDQVRVQFDGPVSGGIAPGQAAVFYDGDILLGGGWIVRDSERVNV
jgi:tRNA-uridine 2-sulfurtransferase